MIFPLDFSTCVFDRIEGDTIRTLSDQFKCHRDGKMRRITKSHKDRFCDFHFELICEWRSARKEGRMNLAEVLAQFPRWWEFIGPPKEGEVADLEEGWCVATQDYLAMSLGCSTDEVSELVQMFERDGWLKVDRYRDGHGHFRNRYALCRPNEIRERATKKDERGRYLRAKNLRKSRKSPANRDGAGRFTHSNATHTTREGHAGGTTEISGVESAEVPRGEPRLTGDKPFGHRAERPTGTVPVSAGFRSKGAGSSAGTAAAVLPSEDRGDPGPPRLNTMTATAKLSPKGADAPLDSRPEKEADEDSIRSHAAGCICDGCLAPVYARTLRGGKVVDSLGRPDVVEEL